MTSATVKVVAVWIISGLLAIAFILTGTPKLLQQPLLVDMFAAWGYAPWFLVTVGALEVAGAILLLIPRVAIYGVALLGVIMLGAGYTHITNAEGLQVARPTAFLVLLITVGWMRRPRRAVASTT